MDNGPNSFRSARFMMRLTAPFITSPSFKYLQPMLLKGTPSAAPSVDVLWLLWILLLLSLMVFVVLYWDLLLLLLMLCCCCCYVSLFCMEQNSLYVFASLRMHHLAFQPSNAMNCCVTLRRMLRSRMASILVSSCINNSNSVLNVFCFPISCTWRTDVFSSLCRTKQLIQARYPSLVAVLLPIF